MTERATSDLNPTGLGDPKKKALPRSVDQHTGRLLSPDAITTMVSFNHPRLRQSERLLKLVSRGESLLAPFGGDIKTFDDQADQDFLGLGSIAIPSIGVAYTFEDYDLSAMPEWLGSFLDKSLWQINFSFARGSVKSEKTGLLDLDHEIWRENTTLTLTWQYFPVPEGIKLIPDPFEPDERLRTWLSLDAMAHYYWAEADLVAQVGGIGLPTIYRGKLHTSADGPGFSVGATIYVEPSRKLWLSRVPRENVRFFVGGSYRYGDLPARYADFDFRGWDIRFGVAFFLDDRD
jgi:hypothetical protein